MARNIYAVHVPRLFEYTILCAGQDQNYSRFIFSTTDAGNNWTNIPVTDWLYDIASYPAFTYFWRIIAAVGENGLIMKSTNGGENWNQINSPAAVSLSGVDFFAASINTGSEVIALAVGSVGTIIRTTDKGETWTSVVSGTTSFLRDVSTFYPYLYTIQDTAVVVGHDGTVLISTDLGLSWVQQPLSQGAHLKAVDFSHLSSLGRFGITVGMQSGSSVIYKTTDGGVTWTQKSSPAINNIPDLTDVCINPNTGAVFAVGSKYIIKSVDSGETWTIVYTGDDVYFHACYSGDFTIGVTNITIVAGE